MRMLIDDSAAYRLVDSLIDHDHQYIAEISMHCEKTADVHSHIVYFCIQDSELFDPNNERAQYLEYCVAFDQQRGE